MAEHTEEDNTIQKVLIRGETNQNKVLAERANGEVEASEDTEELSDLVEVNDNMMEFAEDLIDSSKGRLGKKQGVTVNTGKRKSAQRVRKLKKVKIVHPRAMVKIRDLTKLKYVLGQDDKKRIKEDGLEMKRKNLMKLRKLNVKKLQKVSKSQARCLEEPKFSEASICRDHDYILYVSVCKSKSIQSWK
jgi:hypothetical protein